MEIQELKESLGCLILNDLELLGLSFEAVSSEKEVQLYTPTDDYCEEANEVTWVAAVNNEDTNFLIIAQGTLYDEEAAEETGREVEVGRIFVDDNKAEMLIDALFHAFPDLVYDRVSSSLDSKDEEDEESEDLDERIGEMKKELIKLERLRLKAPKKNPTDSDQCIDTYKKVKRYAGTLKDSSAEPDIVKRKNTILFVSGFEDEKLIRLTEANVEKIVKEQLCDVAAKRVVKSILIDKKLAKVLAKAINKVFINVTPQNVTPVSVEEPTV